jgi:hypothetical protein
MTGQQFTSFQHVNDISGRNSPIAALEGEVVKPRMITQVVSSIIRSLRVLCGIPFDTFLKHFKRDTRQNKLDIIINGITFYLLHIMNIKMNI